MKKSFTNLWLAATLGCFSLNVFAFSADDHQAWLDANQQAQPQFVDGDVITFDKADLVKPFIPAEQQEEVLFEGMEMVIKDAGDMSPAPSLSLIHISEPTRQP